MPPGYVRAGSAEGRKCKAGSGNWTANGANGANGALDRERRESERERRESEREHGREIRERVVWHAWEVRRRTTCAGPPDYTYRVAYAEAGRLLRWSGGAVEGWSGEGVKG